ncbi:MAG TPA: hypothetical protein ENF79_01875 [Nitrososphaeria archaeon]|nr:hypothetical protein [Nitrososphaeria archaeon]
MTRTYKWLGGIGYILTFIPYVNFVSLILIAVAWIMMGRDTREKMFTALGILMIVFFAASISLVIIAFSFLWTLMPMTMPGFPMQPGGEIQPMMPGPFIWGILIAAVILLVLSIVTVIIDIIAHLRAGTIFDNKWFKIGGWLRVAVIVSLAIAIPLIIISLSSAGILGALGAIRPETMPFHVLLSFLWPVAIVVILSLLATIFSIIAFFTIPEEEAIEPKPQ